MPSLAASGKPGAARSGFIEATPNGRNVVSGEVFLCVDLRHPSDEVLSGVGEALAAAVERLERDAGLTCDFKQIITRLLSCSMKPAYRWYAMPPNGAAIRGRPWFPVPATMRSI